MGQKELCLLIPRCPSHSSAPLPWAACRTSIKTIKEMEDPSVSPLVSPTSPSLGHKMAFQGQLLLSQCWCQRLWKSLFPGLTMPCSSQPQRLQLHTAGRGPGKGLFYLFFSSFFFFKNFISLPFLSTATAVSIPSPPDNELLSCAALRAK